MNDYYTFNDAEEEIQIHRHDTPSPWLNYLSNGTMHAFVSQAGGGFAWWKSPVACRLTRYRQYNLPIDSPGFYIYIRHEDGTVWSPTFRPVETPLDSWCAKHRPGRSVFCASKNGIEAELELFVAPDEDVLLWDLQLRNTGDSPAKLDVFAYAEFSQMDWESESKWGYYCRLMFRTWYDEKSNSVSYLFPVPGPKLREYPLAFLASSKPVTSYSGDRDHFVGPYRDERNPRGVEQNNCGNSVIECGEPAAALQNTLSIAPGVDERATFVLGVVPQGCVDVKKAEAARDEMLARLRSHSFVDSQKKKLLAWWRYHLDIMSCCIPDKAAQRQITIWTPVNTVHTGRYSRSVNAVAPGVRGIGFRDTCQDMLSVAYRKPQWAADVLAYLVSQQHEDGHTVHASYIHENKEPMTGIHSDDHLWLPFVANAILAESGDASFLEKDIPWLDEDHKSPIGSATVWEHILQGIRFTEDHLGAHNIPLTLRSDWNDIIGRFARKGKGETVFAGQQYVVALRYLISIAAFINDTANQNWLQDCLQRQQKALLACAWDGKWWRRGFDDDGNPVGTEAAECGKLFLNPQSWAVISGVGTAEQHKSGMQAVADNLDCGLGLKILMPSFPSWEEGAEVAGYGPGCGENGAIFCHANTWTIIAEALLGNAERAWKYFTQLIPHNAMQKVGVERYEAEPYAWVSNIVGPDNSRHGWANVTQVTGTATWMDIAATQYLLGIRPTVEGLLIDPCIPEDWKEISITRRYRGTELLITVKNGTRKQKGISELTVDGQMVAGNSITADLLNNRKKASVTAIAE